MAGDDPGHTARLVRLRLAQLWFVLAVRPWQQYALTRHPAAKRFFAERCPHLAGMIAYFAVFSIIPATFLVLTLLAMTGDGSAQGFILEQIRYVFPDAGLRNVEAFVELLQADVGALGLIGIAGLVWGMLGFFSASESGFNIVYGVENRFFFKQKLWVLFLVSCALLLMVASALVANALLPLLDYLQETFDVRYLDFGSGTATLTVVGSSVAAFVFFFSVYRFLPNTDVHSRDVWKGALVATILFEVSIHALQWYLTGGQAGILGRAFAGLLVLMVWFYLTALVMLLGATLNWWWSHPKDLRREVRRRSFEDMPRAA